jgi:chromosome partitioning protein
MPMLIGTVSLRPITEVEIMATIDLADLEFAIAKLENGRESLLRKALIGSENYDFVLIDCPPSLSLLTVNALAVADKVIIPLQMEVLSLQGLDHILSTIKKITKVVNDNLEIMGVLPVMVDKRRKLSTEIHDYIKVNFKDVHVFENYIRTNVRTTEAPSFGKSVINYAPKSNGAKDYLAFAREFQQINSKQLA